jgi:hypothetical protein
MHESKPMKRFVLALVFFCLGPVLAAAAQTTSVSSPKTETTQSNVTLDDQQKEAVINAAVLAKSRQKTPKNFSPSLGANVPKEVYVHGFTPEVTQKTPLLKQYTYAFLDREVVLVDGPENKIAAIVALPENLIAGGQPHNGAAEASTTNAKGSASPTASVPSHTSPESIK